MAACSQSADVPEDMHPVDTDQTDVDEPAPKPEPEPLPTVEEVETDNLDKDLEEINLDELEEDFDLGLDDFDW